MVSIIIPVYNREKYIEECIRSVWASTYKNYEIILIDDGSTDNTLAICRALAEQDPAIRILKGSHSGVSAARNLGLDVAKGDYVFFLDSDDMIHPQLLEVLAKGLMETNAAMGGTLCVPVLERHWNDVYQHIEKDVGPGEITFQTFDQTLEAVFGKKTPLGMIGGVMIRRDAIGNTRFRTDLYIGEDFFFIYENMIKGGSTIFLKQRWYYARHHEDNVSWDFGYTGFMNRVQRCMLIRDSEKSLGRTKYAVAQSANILSIYPYVLTHKKFRREDKGKIKRTMRSYGRLIFPDLSAGNKVLCIMYAWIPGGFTLAQKIWPSVLKIVHKFRPPKK